MMSELANDLLDAIATGNQEAMNARFADAMNGKINDSLQARKIELAQRIYSGATQEAEPTDDASDTETEETAETVASENGSEEV
jgi:hypothetical protein